MRRALRCLGLTLALAFGLGAGQGAACGLHRPVDLERGILNHVYPDSLHVLAAVWQARQAGLLSGGEESGFALQGPFAFHGLAASLGRLGEKLAEGTPSEHLGFSLVLVDNLLWTRFAFEGGTATSEVHSEGPQTGDPVLVTHSLVLKALVEGRLSGAQAVALGLIRIYGTWSEQERLASLLTGIRASGA